MFHSKLELEASITALNHSNTYSLLPTGVFFFFGILEKKATETLFPVPNVGPTVCYCLQVAFRSKTKHLFIEESIILWLFGKGVVPV